MTFGQSLAQLIHAAGESNPRGKHSYAVALGTSLSKLKQIEKKLKHHEISYVSVYEPDPPFDGELTAIGICPCDRSNKNLRRIVSGIKLLKGKEK